MGAAMGFTLDGTERAELAALEHLECAMPATTYFRFNPIIDNIDFLESDEDKLQAMEKQAEAYLQDESEAVRRLCRMLTFSAPFASVHHLSRSLRVRMSRLFWSFPLWTAVSHQAKK